MFKNKQELIQTLIHTEDSVLDVGFAGQGVQSNSDNYPHTLIKKRAKDVYGVDLALPDGYSGDHYKIGNAETFNFERTFDVIFAGDLIEHLSNPGLFLANCKKHLSLNGRLILTTPNTFNIFNIAGKIMNDEPVTNPDHTFYFNHKTIRVLLKKNDFSVDSISYLYTLGELHRESVKKKLLNIIYKISTFFTDKYGETLVVVSRPVP